MQKAQWKFDIDRENGAPIYRQIYLNLRHAIMSGVIPPGTAFPTQQEFSEILGVNHITFRKAMDLLGSENLIDRRQRVGTLVSDPSHWQPEAPFQSIGLLLWDQGSVISGNYASDLVEDLHRCGEASGLEVKRIDIDPECDDLNAIIVQEKLGGLISLAARKKSVIRQLERVNIPLVALEQRVSIPGVDTILIDSIPGEYEAVQHLISLGHWDIAYVGALLQDRDRPFPNNWKIAQDSPLRMTGFRQALEDAGIRYRPDRVYEIPVDEESAHQLISTLKSRGQIPTALCAFDDKVALYLKKACEAHELRIPDDISLVGFGNFVGQSIRGELATVVVDWPRMARMAVRRLYEQMHKGGMSGFNVTVHTEFKPGFSVAAPPIVPPPLD